MIWHGGNCHINGPYEEIHGTGSAGVRLGAGLNAGPDECRALRQ
jgi:hypothetical protein